jgi:enterochelin esterase family protein
MTASTWVCVACAAFGQAQPQVRSLAEAERALTSRFRGSDEAIAGYLRKTQPPGADLTRGALQPPVGKKRIGWFLEAPAAAKVAVVAKTGEKWALRPLGGTGLHFAVVETPAVVQYDFQYNVDGERRGAGRVQIETYDLGKDSLPQPDVPKGMLTKMPDLASTKAYPGLVYEWWVYTPANHDPKRATALMVFQDGGSYIAGDGAAPIVFDNLIHQKKMPPIVAVFVNPGRRPDDRNRSPRTRGDQYDACTPRYAKFLETEVLPVVARTHALATDPEQRAIAGASSGASCAFTAAWHRPDMFRRVLCQIGSFCDFRGIDKYPNPSDPRTPEENDFGVWKTAHDYPGLIRKTKPAKPLRVFLQEGERDLDNQLGNWPLANRQMAKALEFAGYKHRLVMGPGFHSHKHGRAILPESLVWLWADD